MDIAVWIEYSWILLVLIVLEGFLAADNALVIAVMIKHLPEEQQKKALFYGLAGAFVFRFLSLFGISYLVHVWQLQAVGAIYLLFICFAHMYSKIKKTDISLQDQPSVPASSSNFWLTVLKVELADIAFACDSILAAVALAVTLPETPLAHIGGIDGGHFLVILIGGTVGLILMRFAASLFSTLLKERPGLEIVAFLIVGWVGVKLAVYTLSHSDLAVLPKSFSGSILWKSIFWIVLLIIVIVGWFYSGRKCQRIEGSMQDSSSKN